MVYSVGFLGGSTQSDLFESGGVVSSLSPIDVAVLLVDVPEKSFYPVKSLDPSYLVWDDNHGNLKELAEHLWSRGVQARLTKKLWSGRSGVTKRPCLVITTEPPEAPTTPHGVLEALRYFRMPESAKSIAAYVGSTERAVLPELRKLVESGQVQFTNKKFQLTFEF
jgi:hypothetical protein